MALRSGSTRSAMIQSLVALCIISAIVTFAGFRNRSQISQPMVYNVHEEIDAEKNLADAIPSGLVTKVKIRKPSIFVQTIAEEHKENQVKNEIFNLEKQVYQERPPQNSFKWLYKDKSALVYSAHYDDRDSLIKIVGFKHRFNVSNQELVLCRYPDHTVVPMTTQYNVSVMHPRDGLEYNTWIWVCAWKGGSPPKYVELVGHSQEVSYATIDITYHTFFEGVVKIRKPVLCVKPMVHNYDNAYQLREFLEMSRIWGASKIVIYPYSINEPVIRPILEHYKRQGLVDIHEWHPPVPIKSLHAFGQKSHNQHCLYTYMYRYQWAAFVDLDELIVPNKGLKNFEFMIQAGIRSISNPEVQSNVAGFVIRSQMCSTSLPDDPLYDTEKDLCRITSMRKTNCTAPMSPGVWSKPLVNTDGTEIVDIHTIRLPRSEYNVINLDPAVGTMHHYRALKHKSQVLAQSTHNVRKRNTHLYEKEIKRVLADICDHNNPAIGDRQFAD